VPPVGGGSVGPPLESANAEVLVMPGCEKYADSAPVTSICLPIRDGLDLSPHWDRKAEGIWT
jgi:hypothetical protein